MTILAYCDVCNQFVSRKKITCPKCNGFDLRKAKKWRVNLPARNGKRTTRIVDTKLSDAIDLEAKMRTDIRNEKWFGVKAAPLIHDVFEKLKKHNKAKKLKRLETSRWDIHIAPHITESMTMDQLTTEDIEKILYRMHTTGGRGNNGCAPATINHTLKVIRRLYNYAQKQGLYDGPNPAKNIEPIRVNNQVTNYLKKSEIKRLKKTLKEWDNRRAALIVEFALYTGCRQGEIFALQWDDVNTSNKEIFLRDPKGKPVNLPISDNAVAVLKEARTIKRKSKFKSKIVFCNRFGQKRKYFSQTWTRIKADAKLPEDFRFHDLRHTFATHLASSGKVSLFELQKLLNHQSIQMTMRYAHHLDKALKRAASAVDDLY